MSKPFCPSCSDAGDDFILLHNGLNSEGKGFIHLAWGRELRIQFTPAEARQHALRLLEVAEAAESDAIVYRLLREEIGLDMQKATGVIGHLRQFRDEPEKA